MTLLSNTSTTQKPKNLSLILIAMGVAVAMLYFGRLFFITLVVAITIGFLLDPFVELLTKLRLPRAVGSFVVCSFALLCIYLAGLGAYAQLSVLAEDAPTYSARVNELVDRVTARVERAEQTAYELLIPQRLQERVEQQQQEAEPEPAERRRRSAEPPMPPAIPEVVAEDPVLTGVRPGLYKIRVTHPDLNIPARYNDETTLTFDASPLDVIFGAVELKLRK